MSRARNSKTAKATRARTRKARSAGCLPRVRVGARARGSLTPAVSSVPTNRADDRSRDAGRDSLADMGAGAVERAAGQGLGPFSMHGKGSPEVPVWVVGGGQGAPRRHLPPLELSSQPSENPGY